MACCFLAGYLINKILTTCEALNIQLIKPQYKGESYHSKHLGYVAPQRKQSPSLEHGRRMTRIRVVGMTCASCTSSVQGAVSKLPGVERVSVSLVMEMAYVFYSYARLDLRQIIDAIEDAGFDAMELTEESSSSFAAREREKDEELEMEKNGLMRSFGVASVVAAVEYVRKFNGTNLMLWTIQGTEVHDFILDTALRIQQSYGHQMLLASMLLTAVVQFWFAFRLYASAVRSLRRFNVNMDVLVGLSTGLGYGLSIYNSTTTGSTYFETTALLIAVINMGRHLEKRCRRKAASPVGGLMSLQPATATIIENDGTTKVIPTALLQANETILVPSQTSVPADAYILSGETFTDDSLLTGESLPVLKKPGSLILAGSINTSATITASVINDPSESKLSKMVTMVQDATAVKASIQDTVDYIAGWFGIFIVSLAGFCFAGVLVNGGTWREAVERVMGVLLVACPCALGLATPTALMVGIGAAATRGLLLPGGAHALEALSKTDYVVLDKTGTLTTGRLAVVLPESAEVNQFTPPQSPNRPNTIISHPWSQDRSKFWLLVCAVEAIDPTVHPAAAAILQHGLTSEITEGSWSRFKSSGRVCEFEGRIGKGVRGDVELDGRVYRVVVGRREEFEFDIGTYEPDDEGVMVYVAIDGVFAGRIVLTDTTKYDASTTICSLKSLGMSVAMLTGDTSAQASNVSKLLNIPVLASRALPSTKLSFIRDLQRNHVVTMVGDGLNDTAALTAADCGILISHTSLPAMSSDVILLGDGLEGVGYAVEVGRRTMRCVRRNLWWAGGYNVVVIPLAVCGWIGPLVAGIAMSGSSIMVVMGGLQLMAELESL